MSSNETSVGTAPALSSAPEAAAEKRDWAARVITQILERMGVAVAVDLKDGTDGGISAALKLEGDLPGVQPGRRSHVLEALQFLVNKIVNRPGVERRWVAIGVGSHPEPRPRRPSPPMGVPAARPAPAASSGRTNGRPAVPNSRHFTDDEAVEPAEDSRLSEAVRMLAEQATNLGHSIAILAMNREDRARTLIAVKGLSGVNSQAEGEGRNRRVVFSPERPAPAPRRHPHDPDEDLDE
jgi:predicted RNA-binding protein Jag